jgi:DNA sulfur modification protein DndD
MISLNRIKIVNFRAYEDVEITFNNRTGVILMAGGNGSGKSTFLNAICWCLYADTPFFAIEDSPEIVNMNSAEGSWAQVELEASIDGQTYVFLRKGSNTSRGGTLSVSYEVNGNWTVLDSSSGSDAVKRLLPKDIRHLFIFNGEQISSIFKTGTSHGLKNSIYKVAELNIIDNAVAHLRQVEELYLKEIEHGNKNKKQIEDQRQRQAYLLTDIDREERAVGVLVNQVEVATAKLEELNRVIETTASAREKLQTLAMLKESLTSIDEDLEAINVDKIEKVQDNYHKALLIDEFSQYAEALEQAKKDNLIPPPIVPAVTQRILDSKKCICGRDIHEEEEAFILREHQLNSDKEELRYLTDGILTNQQSKIDLKNVKYMLQDMFTTYDTKSKRKEEIQAKIAEINDSLDDINLQYEDPNARRNEILKDIFDANAARGRISNKIESLKRELRETDEAINKIIERDASTESLDRKRHYTKKLIHSLLNMKQEMEELIREKLRTSLEETFFHILPNTRFDRIEINTDYSVELFEGTTSYATTQISTGQAKALGLSLAYSLSKNLDYASFPMLIDNLYGDLADKHYQDLTNTVEKLSESKQVVIMDLNTEKTRGLFKDGNVKQYFNIDRDETSGVTNVKEIE